MLAYARNMLALFVYAGISQPMSTESDDQALEISGRAKGGKARMEAMTPEERSAQGKLAAEKRWRSRPLIKATHAGPLPLGDHEIQSYVLEDETRVLSQRGLNEAFGIQHGGANDRGLKLPRFVGVKALEPYLSNELTAGLLRPIRFTPPHGGNPVLGIPAKALPEICTAWLKAREARELTTDRQLATAQIAEIIMRGLAHVGIIALVDEATGFQRDRAKDALSKILEAFIAKELRPYVQTFPAEFYDNMFRLRGLEFPRSSVRRPQYFGHLTNDVIYKRLAPGVLEELKKVTPRLDSGRHKDPLFGRLTANKGYPKLTELLGSVVTIMTFSSDWADFMEKLNRRHPRFGDQMSFSFDYPQKNDDGRGL
jgi:hypothetical protein